MGTLYKINDKEYVLILEDQLIHGNKAAIIRSLGRLGLSLSDIATLFLTIDGPIEVLDSRTRVIPVS